MEKFLPRRRRRYEYSYRSPSRRGRRRPRLFFFRSPVVSREPLDATRNSLVRPSSSVRSGTRPPRRLGIDASYAECARSVANASILFLFFRLVVFVVPSASSVCSSASRRALAAISKRNASRSFSSPGVPRGGAATDASARASSIRARSSRVRSAAEARFSPRSRGETARVRRETASPSPEAARRHRAREASAAHRAPPDWFFSRPSSSADDER